MRPIVKLLVRQNIPFASFMKIVKYLYVYTANKDLTLPGKKLSHSRISIVTGIPRKDIKELLQFEATSDESVSYQHNRAARVITGWVKDPEYQNSETHEPLQIPIESESHRPSLQNLVIKYSGGVPVRAVLDELLRIKAVERNEDHQLKLLTYGYTPDQDEIEKLKVVSEEVSTFLKTIQHNIDAPFDESFLQLSARCDNLPTEIMEELRKTTTLKGRDFLQDLAQWMSQYDRDQNDKVFGTGRKRGVIGVYYFEEDVEDREK
jgi:hypothetical protein